MKKSCLNVISVITAFLFTSCYSVNNSDISESLATSVYDETETSVTTAVSSVPRTLSEFVMPEHDKLQNDDWVSIEWDNDELTELLNEAAYIYTFYFRYTYSHNFENSDISPDGLFKTGVSYNSFKNELQKYFTDDFAGYLLSGENDSLAAYTNCDGELCYIDQESGSNPSFDSVSFSITEQTENKITIKAVSRFWHSDEPNIESFRDFYYTVILTENGWRFDDFDDFRNSLIWDENGDIIPLETHIIENE